MTRSNELVSFSFFRSDLITHLQLSPRQPVLRVRSYGVDDLVYFAYDPFCTLVTGEKLVLVVQVLFVSGFQEPKYMARKLGTNPSFRAEGRDRDNRTQCPCEIALL